MKDSRIHIPLFVTLVAIVLVLITACGQPPEEEMAAARQAVEEAAANQDVSRYAPQALERAQQLLSEMESAAESGEYDSARSLAGEAIAAAEQAVQDAAAAKESARGEAESAIAAAEEALGEARGLLRDAGDVRGVSLDFQSLRRDLETGADGIAAAEADLQNEAFADARRKAEDARSGISAVAQRISSAVQAASRK